MSCFNKGLQDVVICPDAVQPVAMWTEFGPLPVLGSRGQAVQMSSHDAGRESLEHFRPRRLCVDDNVVLVPPWPVVELEERLPSLYDGHEGCTPGQLTTRTATNADASTLQLGKQRGAASAAMPDRLTALDALPTTARLGEQSPLRVQGR